MVNTIDRTTKIVEIFGCAIVVICM